MRTGLIFRLQRNGEEITTFAIIAAAKQVCTLTIYLNDLYNVHCTPFANTINACVRGRFQGQGQSLPLSRGTIFDMFDIAKKQRYRVDPICMNALQLMV